MHREEFIAIDHDVANADADILQDYFREAIAAGMTEDEAHEYVRLMTEPVTTTGNS